MIQFKNENCTVFESQLFKTTSTVIETDDCVIVVDPTWLPKEVEEIRQYVLHIRANRPLYLLFTHSDWDHIIGYGAFPEAKVIASEAFVDRQDRDQILEQIREFDEKYYLDRNYPIVYPKVDIIVREDGQVLQIGKASITFYKADGHTNDGIFAIIEPLGIWITGDYLSNVEFPYIYFSSSEYEQTMEKAEQVLERYDVGVLIPGHGHVTESKHEMKKRIEESMEYITNLRELIQANKDSSLLIEGYAYPRGMKGFHDGNVTLMKSERDNS